MDKIELTEEERERLKHFIFTGTKDWSVDVLRVNSFNIRRLAERLAPLFEKGQALCDADRSLINSATETLYAIEKVIADIQSLSRSCHTNLNYIYTGTGLPG